jgi:lysophospholipase L1-like esterase
MIKHGAGLTVLSTFLSLFLLDQTLGFLDFPTRKPIQVAHPSNFFEHRQNIEFEYDFRTNSQGLRNEEIPLDKSAGEIRVLVLGDSFVEGEGVAASDTFVADLQNMVRNKIQGKIIFLNGGLRGTGPLEYWRLFRDVGLKYNPDLVLICIYANDVSNTPIDLSDDQLTSRFEMDETRGVEKILYWMFPRLYIALSRSPAPVVFTDDFVEAAIKEARLRNFDERRIQRWQSTLDKSLLEAARKGAFNRPILTYPLFRPDYLRSAVEMDTENAIRKYQAMLLPLARIAMLAESKGISIGAVYIPSVFEYDPKPFDKGHPWAVAGMVDREWLKKRGQLEEKLREWTSDRQIPFLSLTDTFREAVNHKGKLNYSLDLHWNSNGHRVAAVAIEHWMQQHVADWKLNFDFERRAQPLCSRC